MMPYLLFLMFLLVIVFIHYLKGFKPVKTPNGAIVMGTGILVNIPMTGWADVSDRIHWLMAVFLVSSVAFLVYNYAKTGFEGTFSELYLKSRVDSFATGTWVAGISVTVIAIVKTDAVFFFPVAKLLFFFNLLLWLGYLLLIWRNWIFLWKNRDWQLKTHGVLLLSCVTTQSLVVSAKTLYGSLVPDSLSVIFIVIGALFYLISIRFVLLSIWKHQLHDLADRWANTNCIVHGAISITGVASVVSGAVSRPLVLFQWGLALALLILVEAIELIRASKRVNRYGIKKGLFAYNRTQWARNFTFGMFGTLTIKTFPGVNSDFLIYMGVFLILLLATQYAIMLLDIRTERLTVSAPKITKPTP